MARRSTLFSILVLSFPLIAAAQVPTIVNEIGELESVRDPKCYATASRLEDFIYGTPLDADARFEKIALQKVLIRAIWERASAEAAAAGAREISVEILRPRLTAVVNYAQAADGSWAVHPDTEKLVTISARDKRQYGTIAYALRALLAVQQDALVEGAALMPLEPA